MTFTQEQAERLYRYWLETSENLCNCCGYYTDICKDCEIDLNTDCRNCQKISGTPCWTCFNKGIDLDNFNWNGEVM